MHLAPRQQEALTFTAKGFKPAEIAELMQCGKQNVTNLVRECVFKLRATNKTEAVAIAVKHGLINFCLLATVMAGSLIDTDNQVTRNQSRIRQGTRITRVNRTLRNQRREGTA